MPSFAYQQAHYHYEVIRPIIALFGATERLLNNPGLISFLRRENSSPVLVDFIWLNINLFKLEDMQSSAESAKALLRGISDLKKRLAIEDIPIAKLVQSAGDRF